MRTFGFVAHIIILWGIIRSSISIFHMNTSCIISTIYCFMTKIIAWKTTTKKIILVMDCERLIWWNNSFELILVTLVKRTKFLLVLISFPFLSFIVDGAFADISIAFILSSFSFYDGFEALVLASPLGVFCFSS